MIIFANGISLTNPSWFNCPQIPHVKLTASILIQIYFNSVSILIQMDFTNRKYWSRGTTGFILTFSGWKLKFTCIISINMTHENTRGVTNRDSVKKQNKTSVLSETYFIAHNMHLWYFTEYLHAAVFICIFSCLFNHRKEKRIQWGINKCSVFLKWQITHNYSWFLEQICMKIKSSKARLGSMCGSDGKVWWYAQFLVCYLTCPHWSTPWHCTRSTDVFHKSLMALTQTYYQTKCLSHC